MRKKYKDFLIGIGAISILVIGIWLYNNIVLVSLIIIGILFVLLLVTGLYYIFDLGSNSHYVIHKNNSYDKIIGGLLLFLAIIPGYFLGFIMFNYQESEKYLQQKSIEGVTGLGKAAFAVLRPRAFVIKEVRKGAREDLIEQNQAIRDKNIIEEVKIGTGGLELKVNY